MNPLPGKKTFITALAGLVVAGLVYFDVIPRENVAEVQVALISLLALFLRLGLKSENQKNSPKTQKKG